MKTRFDSIMSRTAIAVAVSIAIGSTPMAALAQNVERSEAIASSDVLSQISMFSYRDGPKSDLFLRGMPIAAEYCQRNDCRTGLM